MTVRGTEEMRDCAEVFDHEPSVPTCAHRLRTHQMEAGRKKNPETTYGLWLNIGFSIRVSKMVSALIKKLSIRSEYSTAFCFQYFFFIRRAILLSLLACTHKGRFVAQKKCAIALRYFTTNRPFLRVRTDYVQMKWELKKTYLKLRFMDIGFSIRVLKTVSGLDKNNQFDQSIRRHFAFNHLKMFN